MKKTTVISVLAVLAVLAAVLTSFFRMRAAESKMPHIVIPDTASAQIDPAGDALNSLEKAPAQVEISTENVMKLIAAMDRPEEYAMEARVTLCWADSENTTVSRVWKSGTLEHVSYVENGVNLHCIIDKETTYTWEQGSQSYYTGATGEFTSDSTARLPTYEDLASLKDVIVSECGTVELDGFNCLYIRTEENSGYLLRDWYIDLESGLLCRMNEYRSGELKYSVVISSITLGPVDKTLFDLPDGRSLSKAR